MTEPNGGYTEVLGEHATNPATPRTTGYPMFGLGREFTVSSGEGRIKAQFEQWVRSNALLAIREMQTECHPDEIRQMMGAYIADRSAKRYNWEGSACRTALSDMPGMEYLLFLCLKRCHPDIAEATVSALIKENPEQFGQAVLWILGNLNAPAKTGSSGAKRVEPMEAEMATLD